MKLPKGGKQLTELEEKLFSYQGEDRIISSHELAAELDKAKASTFRYETGIPSMDRILDGVEAGELLVITGPTGHGKTTLLMSITQNLKDIKSAWFSLEVTPRQFINKLRAGDRELPLFYTPAQNTDSHISWLLERIVEACVKYETKFIFIDHLHQIFSLDKLQHNLSLEIGDVVAQLKNLAIQYGLVVFLVAHMTDNKLSPKSPPSIKDIRDSGMISRLADTVMGVWRIRNTDDGSEKKMSEPEEGDIMAKVRIWKNRREGTLGYFVMEHKDHYLREIDPKEDVDFKNAYSK